MPSLNFNPWHFLSSNKKLLAKKIPSVSTSFRQHNIRGYMLNLVLRIVSILLDTKMHLIYHIDGVIKLVHVIYLYDINYQYAKRDVHLELNININMCLISRVCKFSHRRSNSRRLNWERVILKHNLSPDWKIGLTE